MVGSGGDLSRPKVTDFTIDCILSKSDRNERRALPLSQPMTLNKVLNNNPWIPISHSYFFNPSSLHKKFPLPNLFCPSTTPVGTNIIENLIRVTENHTQSVHNHFFASPHVLALEGGHSLPPKSLVYEKIFCDTHDESLRHNSHNDRLVDKSPCCSPPPIDGGASIENKCMTCSKSFDNSELLEVSVFVL